MSLIKLTLLFSLLTATATAQMIESIEVRVTNVDVVVTDKSGNPVPGLTKEDFELLEDKKPQAITNFYEVREERAEQGPLTPAPLPAPRGEGTGAEMRPRRFVVFVDDYSIDAFRRKEVLASLAKFMDEQLRPGDRVMIASWARTLTVLQPFTADRPTIDKAVAQLEHSLPTAATLDWERRELKSRIMTLQSIRARRGGGGGPLRATDEAAFLIRSYTENYRNQEKDLIASAKTIMSLLSGIDGKKVMVFVGAELPQKPGDDLQQWLMANNAGMIDVAAISESGHQSVEKDLEELGSAANAANVTLYMIDTHQIGAGANAGDSDGSSPQEEFARFAGTAQSFGMLARLTGGQALTNTNNFKLAFDGIARDLGSYYSLGYRPREGVGKRAITVRTKNPDYRVRARSNYVAKPAEEQLDDRVLANIFGGGQKSELPIRVTTGAIARKGFNRFQVPIQVEIPSTITLLPEGSNLVGGFTVYIAVGTPKGALSAVSHAPQSIRIAAADEKELRSKPLVFNAAALITSGQQVLSVAVVDQLSQSAGFARIDLVAR